MQKYICFVFVGFSIVSKDIVFVTSVINEYTTETSLIIKICITATYPRKV